MEVGFTIQDACGVSIRLKCPLVFGILKVCFFSHAYLTFSVCNHIRHSNTLFFCVIVIEFAREYIPKSKNGIYVDDMSNLAQPIYGNRINHSLGWLRHPAKRQPIPLFELMTINWKSECFERLFSRWNSELEKHAPITIKSITVDWYSGFWKASIVFLFFVFQYSCGFFV